MAFIATITYFISLRKVIHNNKNAGNVWRQCNTTHKGTEMEPKMIPGMSAQQVQTKAGFLIHFRNQLRLYQIWHKIIKSQFRASGHLTPSPYEKERDIV